MIYFSISLIWRPRCVILIRNACTIVYIYLSPCLWISGAPDLCQNVFLHMYRQYTDIHTLYTHAFLCGQ
jgi:hypothetical protein